MAIPPLTPEGWRCRQCNRPSGEVTPRPSGKRGHAASICTSCYGKNRRRGLRPSDAKAATSPASGDIDPRVEAARRRIASDFDHLRPEDFDVAVGNDGRYDPKAAQEKRQEFSRSMGEFARELARTHGNPDEMQASLGGYIANLEEGEQRHRNRRLARSVSLQAANEALQLRQFKQVAETYFRDKITPTGYALREHRKPLKRSSVLFLSDLHLGAELSSLDNPIPFGAVQEARRLERVVREWLEYKPQHREHQEGVLIIAGDVIEGLLLHDMRDGAPLTEQCAVFWRHMRVVLALAAQVFPRVRVVCQPGNHGRNKLRHPGRATSSKWDGIEWQLYYALREMCSGLRNVTFDLPFRAVSLLDLHGGMVLVTHGDTEVKLGDPDSKATHNAAELDKVNASRIYGCEVGAIAFGHFHKPRYQPGLLCNGALVPSNGHARSSGWIREPCGQWLWEAVEGFPIGDLRFIQVGPSEDRDEALGTLLKPFRFEVADAA